MESPIILGITPEFVGVAKPPGWLTRPASNPAGNHLPVLSAWMRKEVGDDLLVVHRLDRDTSGVLVFARGPEAHRKASMWFEKRLVRKSYLALVLGRAKMPTFQVRDAIEEKPAQTLFEVIESFAHPEALALIRARPMTGRRHQIRIHLASKSLPIVSDLRYGGRPLENISLPIQRVALHAAKLELPSGEVFEAEPWPDFQRTLLSLRELRGS